MINYCCSRCGEKVPVEYSYRVVVADPDSIEIQRHCDTISITRIKRAKHYILCLSCSVELESWMEEDEKEENTNEHD